MADADYTMRALRAFLNDFVPRVREIAQESAETETALSSKALSDDEKVSARLEFELTREVECWKAIRTKIDELIKNPARLVLGKSERRQEER